MRADVAKCGIVAIGVALRRSVDFALILRHQIAIIIKYRHQYGRAGKQYRRIDPIAFTFSVFNFSCAANAMGRLVAQCNILPYSSLAPLLERGLRGLELKRSLSTK